MDQTTQMDLRDAYAAEHHSQTPGSIVAKVGTKQIVHR